jgi:transcriptional regulator with XRE-family HTH domain
MNSSLFGPVELPPSAWRCDEMHKALRARDAADLLRLSQRYSGVSQARLATATGIGQGRINEIINGRRRVTRIDVFERVADGLTMPDEARVLMGLAPASAAARGAFAGHAEIAQVFQSQYEANAELRAQAATAAELDLLAARALGLIALNDSLLRSALSLRTKPIRVRVLLLDPDAPAVAVRASEIGESSDAFANGIRLSIARIAELTDHPCVDLQVAIYQELPTWRMIRLDDTLYLSAFGRWSEGHRSGMYKLTAAANGVLHAGFIRHFQDAWQRAQCL